MRRIIEAATKRSILIVTCIVLIFAWGGVSAYQMQRDYMPPISNPTLMITVQAQNYQANRVQSAIAAPIEQAVRAVDRLETVESNAFDGGLLISLYFPMQTDMQRVQDTVSRALDHVTLPSDVAKPVVTEVTSSSFPIMRLSVTGNSGQVNETALRTVVQQRITDDLKHIQGVSDVRVVGGGNNGYVVNIHRAALEKAGLTIDDVKHTLSSIQPTSEQGTITSSQVSIPIQINGWQLDANALKQTPIHTPSGKNIPLGSIADVSQSIVNLQTISRADGKPSVMFDILKTPSSNITDVSERIRNEIPNIPDVKWDLVRMSVLYDQGKMIQASLNSLIKEGLLGCLFSMLCVLFVFRNVRSTVLIALSLPICLLTTTGILYSMGISLNILTVSGLIVAMGRVVDDTIVILDNIHRKTSESGLKASPALLASAVREMVPAVVSSTASTVAVYLPIALIGGMISAAFSGFSWSVVIALITSLVVSLLVVPALYTIWKKSNPRQTTISSEPAAQRVIAWVGDRKGITMLAIAALFVCTIVAAAFLPVSLLPSNKSGDVKVEVELPEGSTLSDVDQEVHKAETVLQQDPNITTYSSNLGSTFTPQYDDVFDSGGGWIQGSNTGYISVSLKPHVDLNHYMADLQNRLSAIRSMAIFTVSNQNIAGDDSQLKIILTGSDDSTLDSAAALVRSKLHLIPGLSVEGAADDQDPISKYTIALNKSLIESAGVDVHEVLKRIQDYTTDNSQIEVTLGSTGTSPVVLKTDLLTNADGTNSGNNNHNSNSTSANKPEQRIFDILGSETFTGKNGKRVRLDHIASLIPDDSPSVLRDQNGHPFSLVTANITANDIEGVTKQVENVLDTLPYPAGVTYTIGGTSEQVNQMIEEMVIALTASVLLILLIVSAVFRGWRAPVSVLLCIPLALIGSVWGMVCFGKEWDLAALVGLLMLTGIVVTNGIVLVDRMERNLARGMDPKEAILQGTLNRVRPVLMTAATTVLTLLPLALSYDHDSLISQTLGIVVIGGMISSTLISLLVIPIVYEWMHRKRTSSSNEADTPVRTGWLNLLQVRIKKNS